MRRLTQNFIALLFLFLQLFSVQAQSFIHKKAGEPLDFREMQRQFAAWSKTHDLKTTKHWKYFKRWENEMQLHTNGIGEPGDPAIYIDASVTASTLKRNLKSTEFQVAAWSPVGPFAVPGNNTGYMENGIGRINCIAFHPTNPDLYYVGVAQGGIWKTTNNGVSWTPISDGLPILRISDICLDPNDPNTLYASVCDFAYIDIALSIDGRKRNTHYGLGVYKTSDGGANWQPTGLSFQQTDGDASLIRKVIVNPANSQQLVACGVTGIYTSADAGTSWVHVQDSLIWDMVQDPVEPDVLYAASGWLASSDIGYAAIYKSLDFGANWTLLNTGIPGTDSVQRIRIAIAPSDHNCIYAMCVDAYDGSYGLYKSLDAGQNWTFSDPGVNMLDGGDGSGVGGQGTYDLGFAVNAVNKDILYVGGVNMWASLDGGQSFNPVSYWTLYYGPTIHADVHFIETQPGTGNIFVCNDGGLYRTATVSPQSWADAQAGTPWPTQWTNISNGMAITSFYRLSSSRNSLGRLAAGSQDNSTFYFNGSVWSSIFGGDGMDNFLDPIDGDFVLGSSQYGYFYYTYDGGFSSMGTNANVNQENAEWTTPLVADYNNYGTLYVGCSNVNKSEDNGYSWFSLAPLPYNGIYPSEISALAVANTDENKIYAARRVRYEYNAPGAMFVSSDAGSSWFDITAGLPDSLYITSVEASQIDANTAYASFAGFSDSVKVFRTTTAGLSWENISYNLPNIPVNCVKTIPGNGRLMAATDLGIYVLNSAGTAWVSQSLDLPNVIVTDIEFNVALNRIYISTFGRGIWETELSSFVGVTESALPENGVSLFPSPNKGDFTIQFDEGTAVGQAFPFEVVDITGRIVYRASLSGQLRYHQSLSLLPGMYFARIGGKGVQKFVVE